MDLSKHYSHCATILPVTDVERSIQFYENILGFETTFKWGDPVNYAVLKANESISVHLTITSEPYAQTSIYVFVHAIDELYDRISSKDRAVAGEIADREYEMRDFDLKDPDGHRITFGCAIERA